MNTAFLALVLLIAIAYSIATCMGNGCGNPRIEHYAGRIQDHQIRLCDTVILAWVSMVNVGFMGWNCGPPKRSS